MTVQDAISAAESILPGVAAPANQIDPRWQAIIRVADFVASNPQDVLAFVVRWGGHQDEDLRAAVATCLLEHLLEADFDHAFPRIVEVASADALFASMCRTCWPSEGDLADQRRQMEWREFLTHSGGS